MSHSLSSGGGGGTTSSAGRGGQVSLHDLKYLSIPLSELDEDDQINLLRHKSSLLWNRIVGIGIVLMVIGAIIISILFYKEKHILHHHHDHNDDNQDEPTFSPTISPLEEFCYLSNSCENLYQKYDSQGFTNLTGWNSTIQSYGCCDICQSLSTTSTTLYPHSIYESSSIQTIANPIQYDYLLMDFMWLPQFCNALDEGHDFTVSHLRNSTCLSSYYSSQPRMTIHGLWPNNVNSFLSCCHGLDSNTVPTLMPEDVETWTIYPMMNEVWFDPTTQAVSYNNEDCSICYLLNHEWQKHGSCFGLPGGKTLRDINGIVKIGDRIQDKKHINVTKHLPRTEIKNEDAYSYFESGLIINEAVAEKLDTINSFANQIISVKSIKSLFSYQVNVICDPLDSYEPDSNVMIFSELQTCWDVILDADGGVSFTMKDCPNATAALVTTPCLDQIYLRPFPIAHILASSP